MVSRVRYVLSLPAVCLLVIATWTLTAMWKLATLLRHGAVGGKIHVYWPLLQLKRIIRGEPSWKPDDLLVLRIQPPNAAARKFADRDKRLMRVVCRCGEDNCANKTGVYMPYNDLVALHPTMEVIPPGSEPSPPSARKES